MRLRIPAPLRVSALVFGFLIIAGGEQSLGGGKQAEFKGKLVCMSCTLKSDEGARADCKTYGHRHALETEDGQFITFLENKYAENLFKGTEYHDKEISIQGVFYESGGVLDVESYTVDDVTVSWCETHKVMDRCYNKK